MIHMKVMGKLWNMVHGLRPILMMIVIQIMSAGMVIMYKLASEYDMSMKVLTAYRYILASTTLIPLSFFMERKSRPKLTWMIVLQAFSSAFFAGTIAQNMYAESLVLTSATFATAMFNLVPAVTFIMAILFRIEKLGLKSISGKAKVVGTLTSISGAMVLTLYKGVEVKLWSTSINLLHKNEQQATHHHGDHHNPLLGTILIITSVITSSFSLIIQSKMSVGYPCHYSSSALICSFGALQTTVYALCAERNWSRWKLGWDVRLLTCVYAGVVASGLSNSISMWCVRVKGPLFVSIFNPMMLIMVAIASSLFLKEKLFLGSVLGATFIICGLYIVIWGKSKEMKRVNKSIPAKSIEEADVTTDAATVDEINNTLPNDPLGVMGPDMISPIILSSEGDEKKEIST